MKREKKATKTNVLIIYYSLDVGGVEKKITEIISSSNSKEVNFSLALFKSKGIFLKRLPKEVKIFNLNKKKGIKGFFVALVSLAGIVREREYQVYFCYGDLPLLFACLARLIDKITNPLKKDSKVVLGVGNIMSKWIQFQKTPIIRKIFMKLLYPRVDVIIAVSEAVKNDLIKNFSVDRKKIAVIYNFIEIEKRKISPKLSSRKTPKTWKVIYVGRFVRQKRLQVLIKAVALLKNKLSVDLLLVGKGPEEKKLKRLIEKYNVSKKVKFISPTLKIKNLINKADLAVLPSAIEGQSNFALEAMAEEVPVLSTNYPGAGEIITDGVDGFIVSDYADAKEIAEKLHSILRNRNILMKVGKKAEEKVKMFSKEEQVKKYTKLLCSL